MKLYGSEVYNIPPPATPEDDALARVCVWCAQQDAEAEVERERMLEAKGRPRIRLLPITAKEHDRSVLMMFPGKQR
jgi:hypothetical protein